MVTACFELLQKLPDIVNQCLEFAPNAVPREVNAATFVFFTGRLYVCTSSTFAHKLPLCHVILFLAHRVKADDSSVTTLRASLSGTFLQTLPDLVTPLKGHSYLRAAVQRRGQRPPKGSGTDMTGEAT